jgi:hypothetical protein
VGSTPTLTVEVANASEVVGLVTVKGTAFDVPPPGAGLETVTEAVLAEARAEAGTSATSWWTFTNAVLSGVPFQFTTEVGTNPVPFTVSVRPGEPGAAASGRSGWLTSGIGLTDWATRFAAVRTKAERTMSADDRTEKRRRAIYWTTPDQRSACFDLRNNAAVIKQTRGKGFTELTTPV